MLQPCADTHTHTFFTTVIYLINPAVSRRHHCVNCEPQTSLCGCVMDQLTPTSTRQLTMWERQISGTLVALLFSGCTVIYVVESVEIKTLIIRIMCLMLMLAHNEWKSCLKIILRSVCVTQSEMFSGEEITLFYCVSFLLFLDKTILEWLNFTGGSVVNTPSALKLQR